MALLLAGSAAAFDHAAVLARAKAAYEPELAARGLALRVVVTRQGLISAHADIAGTVALVAVDEALIAASRTEDSFAFSVCHEFGHLSGTPPRRLPPPEWDGPVGEDGLMLVSDEGQSDYWAAAVCMPRVIAGAGPPPAPEAWSRCLARFGPGGRAGVCARVAQAGLDFLRGLAIQTPVSFTTPSRETVPATAPGYPSRQCRLDTIMAGALGEPRPACWYRG